MKRLLILFSIAAGLSAQTPSYDANGGYIGAAASARARGLELGFAVPGSCDGPIGSTRLLIQKIEGEAPLRASLCLGAGLFAPRWYLHAGPAIAHDPVHGGQAGVALWGVALIRPSLYAGLDARTLWGRAATDHQVTVSIGWHLP